MTKTIAVKELACGCVVCLCLFLIMLSLHLSLLVIQAVKVVISLRCVILLTVRKCALKPLTVSLVLWLISGQIIFTIDLAAVIWYNILVGFSIAKWSQSAPQIIIANSKACFRS